MGKVISVRVKEKGSKNGFEYKNSLNLHDPYLLLIIFKDLKNLFNAPVEKACLLYLNSKEKVFPFG